MKEELETSREYQHAEIGKNIFIIKSALTTRLSLELAYRDPGTLLQRMANPKHHLWRVQSLGDQNRELRRAAKKIRQSQ
jgi:hypothetical protein